MLPIDKNIPIPPAPKRGGYIKRNTHPQVHPWRLLRPGDSFLVPNTNKSLAYFQQLASQVSSRCQYAFTVRDVDGGIRIWRV